MPAESAFVKFKFEVFLDLSFGRMLEETILADIVPTGEQDDGIAFGGDHEF